MWDHPHAYGDKNIRLPYHRSLRGSSPRVWGQAVLVSSAIAAPGIIPTRMGTRQNYHTDYTQARGSSPRVWGQVLYLSFWMELERIIPTRMGTSSYCYIYLFGCKDHPHAYGDKASLKLLIKLLPGSSPRVWGQEILLLSCGKELRIIPTRMGTSLL